MNTSRSDKVFILVLLKLNVHVKSSFSLRKHLNIHFKIDVYTNI